LEHISEAQLFILNAKGSRAGATQPELSFPRCIAKHSWYDQIMNRIFQLAIYWLVGFATFVYVAAWLTPLFLMHVGILKYACMQPISPTMQATMNIAFSPLLVPGIWAFLIGSGTATMFLGRQTYLCFKSELEIVSLLKQTRLESAQQNNYKTLE